MWGPCGERVRVPTWTFLSLSTLVASSRWACRCCRCQSFALWCEIQHFCFIWCSFDFIWIPLLFHYVHTQQSLYMCNAHTYIWNLYPCVFPDGERHVWREPRSHPDPRAHPHHDWPGELLLLGGCLLVTSFWSHEASGPHVANFPPCKLPRSVGFNFFFFPFRRMTSSLLQCSTWWWGEVARSLREAQEKACSPASTWTCSTGEVLI